MSAAEDKGMNGAYGAKGTRCAFVPGMNGAEGAVPTACAPSFVLGTAGHIDHGKSALVKALTGTDPDRLEEEKRRGITIELGFAQMVLPDGTRMGVVDVPGHERFVRQMIAGATGVDLALLCVAADDGVEARLTTHKPMLDAGRLQDGEPFLDATALRPVARVGADLAQRLSLAAGQEVTVATAAGSITLPAVVGGVSDGTVWLPECSAGSTVHQTLGAGHGSQVTVTHAAEVLR